MADEEDVIRTYEEEINLLLDRIQNVYCQLCVQFGTNPPHVATCYARDNDEVERFLCIPHFKQFCR